MIKISRERRACSKHSRIQSYKQSNTTHEMERSDKKRSKKISLTQDISSLTSYTLGEVTNLTYRAAQPQNYLSETTSTSIKSKILNLRLHTLPIWDFNPRWTGTNWNMVHECRLCGTHQESWAHLLCCCKNLINERRKWLKPIFLKKGVRTCLEATELCFGPNISTMDLASFAKYATQLSQKLHLATQSQAVELPPTPTLGPLDN